ncbi:hypothetical protein C8R45DRAFT_1183687 [Mycena sanguinolenta]|nr:hypothetical protein C8R45DRAFT_1183687 [Mycena sanguinolenta]
MREAYPATSRGTRRRRRQVRARRVAALAPRTRARAHHALFLDFEAADGRRKRGMPPSALKFAFSTCFFALACSPRRALELELEKKDERSLARAHRYIVVDEGHLLKNMNWGADSRDQEVQQCGKDGVDGDAVACAWILLVRVLRFCARRCCARLLTLLERERCWAATLGMTLVFGRRCRLRRRCLGHGLWRLPWYDNNLAELWSLLNFILPDIFDDVDAFQEWIGQTKPVLIFRLVSAHTIEEKIMQKATEKRKLEALVIAKDALLASKFKIPASEGKRTTMAEVAADLLRLEGEQIDVLPSTTQAGDANTHILNDEDLEALLDRSPEVFAHRGTGWKSSEKQAAFAVFEPPPDAGSEALAGMMGEEEIEDLYHCDGRIEWTNRRGRLPALQRLGCHHCDDTQDSLSVQFQARFSFILPVSSLIFLHPPHLKTRDKDKSWPALPKFQDFHKFGRTIMGTNSRESSRLQNGVRAFLRRSGRQPMSLSPPQNTKGDQEKLYQVDGFLSVATLATMTAQTIRGDPQNHDFY